MYLFSVEMASRGTLVVLAAAAEPPNYRRPTSVRPTHIDGNKTETQPTPLRSNTMHQIRRDNAPDASDQAGLPHINRDRTIVHLKPS